MNTDRQVLTAEADALTRALAAGDEREVRRCLAALTQLAEGELCQALAEVARRLHLDLDTLPRPPGWSGLARQELPDASQRLDHVVQLTEQAANQTLDCIEHSQRVAEGFAQHADPEVREGAERLRQHLRDAAAAQAYQDLTGQLLRQVTRVLAQLQTSLDTLLADVPGLTSSDESSRTPQTGPLLPGRGASQGDADELLESFGL